MVTNGYYLEILTEAPAERITPDPPTGVDIEVAVYDVSLVAEMPGPAMVELQTPIGVRRDYEIGTTEPTDPAIMVWYKIT